ncbi:MAG: class SAM-dependent methyltransferase [Ilumatobacteraceae bacterium]|nr:class SAM-dependent methyltransferase [Ilumatobacteraceae bacterium]
MNLSEFVPSPGSKVRVPVSSATPAGYLDGAELALLRSLTASQDRSVGSTELAAHVHDWPTLYHLTPYRSTILDCLDFHHAGSASVLELGAGCGAITRWLGEHFGTVHAVEGSVDRASVAQVRTDDLASVQVFSTNYSQLEERDAYDVATLIGVLEYGHLYHPTTNDPAAAALDNLRVAHRALREDSVLVVAIENRLGLKYLSGAREDHSGRRYESINGYPQTDHAVTFSARHLEALLGEAGFDHVDVLLPFPDYKLASTIIDPSLVRDEHHIHNWVHGTAPDWGNALRTPAFSETLAVRELAAAGLLKDLANSFLILAYRGDRDATNARLGISRDWVARHYSLDRRPSLRKRVTLPAAGDHVVNETALGGERAARTLDLGPFTHALRDEPFVPGDLAIVEVLRTLVADGLGPQLLEHVRAYTRWLTATHGTGRTDADGIALVDGAALDAVWINLVADPATGEWSPVDREWAFRGVLPVDYLAWRNVNLLYHRFADDLPAEWRAAEPDTAAFALLAGAGVTVDTGARLTAMRELEAAFQGTAGAGPMPSPSATVRTLMHEGERRRFLVLAQAEEVIARPELLRAYADTFGSADPATLVLDPAHGGDDLVGRLRGAIETAGLDEDTMPDAVLLAPGDPVNGEAVLTTATWGPESLPRFAAPDMPALRVLAEHRWSSVAG